MLLSIKSSMPESYIQRRKGIRIQEETMPGREQQARVLFLLSFKTCGRLGINKSGNMEWFI